MTEDERSAAKQAASNERRTTLIKYGDKLVPLGDRLDVIEKRLNIITVVLGVLTIDHLATLPMIVSFLQRLFGGI